MSADEECLPSQRGSVLARTRVLLADDNPLIAAQIREVLEETFAVVGVVSSGEELEEAFEALTPEVVVADIVMPGEGGLAAVQHILARHPHARVVLLSVIDASAMIRTCLAAGIHGYVVKEDAADELPQAVGAAMERREYISAAGRRRLSV
jgi:two-component system, NarL family, invasion response regulator UvrY